MAVRTAPTMTASFPAVGIAQSFEETAGAAQIVPDARVIYSRQRPETARGGCMGVLDGKAAIITGAGRGIGRAEAVMMAAEGARVTVNDVDGEAASDVVEEITAAGGTARADSHDVSTWAGADAAVTGVVTAEGRLDVL